MNTWKNKVEVGQKYKEVDSGMIYKVHSVRMWVAMCIHSPAGPKPRRIGIVKLGNKLYQVARVIDLARVKEDGTVTSGRYYPERIVFCDTEEFLSYGIKGKDLPKHSWIFRSGSNVLDDRGRLRVAWKSKLLLV